MTETRAVIVAVILGTLVFAGCLGGDSSGTGGQQAGREARRIGGSGGFVGDSFAGSVSDVRQEKPDYDFSNVIVADHGVPDGHAIRDLHTHKFGLEQAAYNTMVEGKDPTAYDSGFTAIDVWDDGQKFYACVTHFAGNGGADLVDITDPNNIVVLGHIDSGMVNSDCQFTDDGKYLFLGAYAGAGNEELDAIRDMLRDGFRSAPVAGLHDLGADGVSVWNTEDKANPAFMFFSNTGTYHNLFTVTIDGQYYLLQTYPTGDRPDNIYLFNPEGGGSLTPVSKTDRMDHDMTVARHPVTGDWLLYTGRGRGLGIFNFNDPLNPVLIGEWVPANNPGTAKGWHEQEVIPQLVDGKALVIVAGERGDGASEPYGVIDVTDPTNPTLLSEWDLPGKPNSPNPNFYTFSPHEIGTWNGYVIIANYHAGVWLWDVGTEERMYAPVTLGHFYANEDPAMHGAPQNPPFAFNPDHWGAYFDSRGYVVTADWGSGLYVLKFDQSGTWTPPAPAES